MTYLTTTEFPITLLRKNHYALWLYLVQINNIENFHNTIINYAKLYPELSDAKDSENRMIVEMASVQNREAIQSVSLIHGRYRFLEARPEHQSATCFVFKAQDEWTMDESTGKPIRVALKLMRFKSQYIREIEARKANFSTEYIIDVLSFYPAFSELNNWSDEVQYDKEGFLSTGKLSKQEAEKLFCVVMPLADRNMFVALKQERFAGTNMDIVRHVFQQIVLCVSHMHEKGYIHGDIKPLNIVRVGAEWKLLDLDATCQIGIDVVGFKSSTACVPPELIYTNKQQNTVLVISEHTKKLYPKLPLDLLIAHPSFDIWSLGCILYQLCTDARQLFQGGQDDNLGSDLHDDDNLWTLAEWPSHIKAKKLSKVLDPFAKNLLALILTKDPLRRPTIARILSHPFLSKKSVARLSGETAEYDVFISYRVASDANHAEKIYDLLTERGIKVWWDKKCLPPGKNWEEGFCSGLVNSRSFVCLLSRNAINHPENPRTNYTLLTPDTNYCDNVYLEHRFALELRAMGYIESIFPVMIGDYNRTTQLYSNFFKSGCSPRAPDICVKIVEDALMHHMEHEALGTPIEPNKTVSSVLSDILKCQGAFIEQDGDETFVTAADSIVKMLATPISSSTPAVMEIPKEVVSSNEIINKAVDIDDANNVDDTELYHSPSGKLLPYQGMGLLLLRKELMKKCDEVNRLEAELKSVKALLEKQMSV